MASAAFASMNESGWAAHMGKVSSYPNSNPSSNNNPKKKQKKVHPATPADGRYNNANGELYGDAQTASDDAYSFNQTSTSRNAGNYGGYLVFNVASYTKSELVELRRRLCSELDQIRDLRDQIESGQISTVENPRSQPKSKKANGNKRPFSSTGSFFDNPTRDAFDTAVDVDPLVFEGLLKECGKIVVKLMKHKHGYVFKTPVDAVAMGLHDYHLIVKRPMDLGTVKSNLGKNMYPTPIEFAEDVRLIFNNALLYNPKHDPVSGMAEQLLLKFEELFKPIQESFDAIVRQLREEKELRERELREFRAISEHNDLQGSSWNNNGVSSNLHKKPKKPKVKSSPVIPPPLVANNQERVQAPAMQAHSSASTPSNPPLATTTQQQDMIMETYNPNLPVKDQKAGRGGTVKQPKPRAKDPNKREMSMEEKQKLGLGLQNLPQEKMPQLLQIIRKRNEHLAQDGDEIELDIEALDTETLWELDRFVTNWKKMVSKTKRQALMMNNNVDASGVTASANPISEAYVASDNNEDDPTKKSKENEDEDVDIDDDMPETSFPPVEIERDDGQGIGGTVADDKGQDEPEDEHDQHRQEDPHEDNNDINGRGNASSSSSSSGSSSSGSSSSSGINADLTCIDDLSCCVPLPQMSTECSFVRAALRNTDSESGSSSGSDSDADDAQS